MGVLKPPE
jgi:hypothetical protein